MWAPARQNALFQHVFVPEDANLPIVDLDAVHDGAKISLAEKNLAGCQVRRITRPNCSICAGIGRKNWIRHFMRPADKRDAGRQAQILRRFPCRQPFRVTEVSSRSMERVIQLSDAGASG